MLDFRPKKPVAGVRFSLDKAEQLRHMNNQQLSRRRRWHGLFLVLVIGAIAWLGYDWIHAATQTPPLDQRLDMEPVIPPMARPTLDGMPAMPAPEDIASQDGAMKEAIDKGVPPEWSSDQDAPLLSWMRGINARDREHPPLPQAIETKDLLLRRLRVGPPVFVSGQLIDSAPAPYADGSPGWQRHIIQLEPDHYCLLLSTPDAANLPVGDQLQAVGRFVGYIHVPTQPTSAATTSAPAFVEVPFIVARQTLSRGTVDKATLPFWEAEGTFSVPFDIYDNVDDERLILETRAYYYSLGQVAREQSTPGVFAAARNANQCANDLHQTPASFRGQPFTVRGKVFHAWNDAQVARDKPFGVQRAVRIILWSEDLSPITTQVNGQSIVAKKLVTRVFEIAAITDQPLPAPGTVITATGRFLRLRAMEVSSEKRRDTPAFLRQSDRSYTFFFVTNPWTEIPPDPPIYTWTPWHWVMLALVVAIAVFIVWHARRREKNDGHVQEAVRKLRTARKKPSSPPPPPNPNTPTSS